jgi:predicted Zn-dependent protease
VEGSGRSQLNFYSMDQDVALGRQVYDQELKGKKVLPATDPRAQRVQRIGDRIEAASRKRHPAVANQMEWVWTVVDEPGTVNAWMVPGGRAAVYTGMIDFARSDDELAVVMGHEACHAIARHGTERVSHGTLIGTGTEIAGAAAGSPEVAQGSAMAAHLLLQLPHSRDQEIEADEMGLLTAAQAGYDPRSAIDLWRRMQSQNGGSIEFLSTHPSESTRIERLQALMPQATAIWQRARADAPAANATAPRSQAR